MEAGIFTALLCGSIVLALGLTRGVLEIVLRTMSAARVPVAAAPRQSPILDIRTNSPLEA